MLIEPQQVRAVDCLLDLLQEMKVKFIFGNPGTFEQGFMARLSERPGFKYLLGLHETVAVAMADGYARASGGPAFVNLHISVGLANGLSQIYNARVHRSPVIVTAGQAESDQMVFEPTLAADTVEMSRQFTKWSYELRASSDVVPALRRAFKISTDPPPGPVFLSLPIDHLEGLTSLVPPHDGAAVTARSQPDRSAVDAAANLLRASHRPMLICGDDVGRCHAVESVVRLAEVIGADVYALNQTEVAFPNNHPQFVRTLDSNSAQTGGILSQADVVMVVGGPVFSQVLKVDTELLPRHTPLIHLDSSSWETGKNLSAAVAMACDLALGCEVLTAALQSTMSADELAAAGQRKAELVKTKAAAGARLEQRLKASRNAKEISSLALMSVLSERLATSDYTVVEEATTSAGALSQAFGFSVPGSRYSNKGGALGWALPAALGVQLARPEQTVVAVIGDGAANYSIQALWTAAHYDLPVKVLICSNRQYRVLKKNIMKFLPDFDTTRLVGMDLTEPTIDFVSLARGYGVAGFMVNDQLDLPDVIGEWLSCAGPALLDVTIEDE